MNARSGAARELRRCLWLAGGISLFVHLGTLVVPIYDMHLFDTVLRSRSIETLVALSIACAAGVLLYGMMSWLRTAALMLAGQRLAVGLLEPVLQAGLARSLDGDPRAGAEALRDLSLLRALLAGPASSTPFDLLWSPLLLLVLFVLHPAIGWLALAGIGVLLAFALLIDRAAADPVHRGSATHEQAVHDAGVLLHDRALADGLGMQRAMARRFLALNHAAGVAHDQAHRRAERLAAASRSVRQGFQGLLIALGAVLVLRHDASPGMLVGANLLFAMLLAPVDQAVACWHQILGARLAWGRLSRLLQDDAPPPAANDDAPDAGAPGLAVDGLGFRADGREILSGLAFAVPPGEMLLVTGPSGAGKSTLARLLAGVLSPTSGTVRLDGAPLAACDRTRVLGYLPSRLHLLEGTVAETIARFTDAPAGAIVAAAGRAGIHAAIGRLPEGYATRIGPQSALLSGGQKQRLALARALFGNPRLIVLDEPDASLDHEGEGALRSALAAALAEGAAVVAVAHRAGLVGLADQVLTLEAGRPAVLRRQERQRPAA